MYIFYGVIVIGIELASNLKTKKITKAVYLLHKLTMKNTIFTSSVVTILSAFLLQSANIAVASSNSGESVSNNSKKDSPGSVNKNKPLESDIHKAVKALVNTSHEGLVEEKTSKGVEMKLKGRFRTAPVATIDEKGEVSVRDYTSPPAE